MRTPAPPMQPVIGAGANRHRVVQARDDTGRIAPTPGNSAHLRSLVGRGRPLSVATRAFFEPRFGHDFSQVRIHAGERAAAVAHGLQAKAFTIGQDIVFGHRQYAPEIHAGRRLLAHELTHVIQQDAVEATGSPTVSHRGVDIVGRSHGPLIQREQRRPRRSTAPVSPPTAQRTYNQALARLRSLNSRMHRYIAAAPLNGGPTTILRSSQTSAAGVRTTTLFRLEVVIRRLAHSHGHLQRRRITPPTGTGTVRTRTVSMRLVLDPPSGATAVTDLTDTLFHEGMHLLIHMDRYLPAGAQSGHGAGLATYRRVAQAHASYSLLLTELEGLINTHFHRRASHPRGSANARAIVRGLVEEKYVEDQTARALRRPRQRNHRLASDNIGGDLMHVLGITMQQLITGSNLQRTLRILDRAREVLDAIDARPGRPAPTPTPPTSPP